MATKRKFHSPIHPGEILFEDFMRPMDVSINRLARDIAHQHAASPKSLLKSPKKSASVIPAQAGIQRIMILLI